MKWNDKQRKILDSIALDRNILVSAAAGSGKTAVLVERIVNSVAEGRCGIDEVLVVTFTKAAAAQMKGKIIAEMEKRAYATQDARLIRQLSVAPNADISTIDSFCNRVVRENFQMAGIDPAYGVFDSGEEALLFEEILDEVLNRLYEDPEFAGFARAFTRKTYKDEYLRDLILSTFRVSEAFADPDKWLDSCRSEYWQEKYLEEIQKKAAVAEADLSAEIAFYVAETDPDSVKYAEKIADVLQADVDIYRKLKKAKKLTEVAGAFAAKAPAFRGNDYCKAYDEDQIADLAACAHKSDNACHNHKECRNKHCNRTVQAVYSVSKIDSIYYSYYKYRRKGIIKQSHFYHAHKWNKCPCRAAEKIYRCKVCNGNKKLQY